MKKHDKTTPAKYRAGNGGQPAEPRYNRQRNVDTSAADRAAAVAMRAGGLQIGKRAAQARDQAVVSVDKAIVTKRLDDQDTTVLAGLDHVDTDALAASMNRVWNGVRNNTARAAHLLGVPVIEASDFERVRPRRLVEFELLERMAQGGEPLRAVLIRVRDDRNFYGAIREWAKRNRIDGGWKAIGPDLVQVELDQGDFMAWLRRNGLQGWTDFVWMLESNGGTAEFHTNHMVETVMAQSYERHGTGDPSALVAAMMQDPAGDKRRLERQVEQLAREVKHAEAKAADAEAALRDTIADLERMGEAPRVVGAVIATREKRLTVSTPSGVLDVATPSDFAAEVGDMVTLLPDTFQVWAAVPPLASGEIVVVQGFTAVAGHNAGVAECTVGGQTLAVSVPRSLWDGQALPAAGDRLVLDPTRRVALRVLYAPPSRYEFAGDAGVTWDDVGGNAAAKRELREAVELARLHPEVFAHYGRKPPKGVLLYGPPGCGKTMLAKAAASALAAGGESGYWYVKGPEILDPYVGVTEATVRELFARTRAHHERTGQRGVLFIDEADAILGTRGGRHSFMEKTIVPAFLAEMDGLHETGALVILATNRPDELDPAVVRSGRIDRKVRIGRPGADEAAAIFRRYLAKVPVEFDTDGAHALDLADEAAMALFSPRLRIQSMTLASGLARHLTLGDIASGALIANAVDQAAALAMQADLDRNKRTDDGRLVLTGVGLSHVLRALEQLAEQNRDLDHTEALAELAGGATITHVRRADHVAETA